MIWISKAFGFVISVEAEQYLKLLADLKMKTIPLR